MNPPQDNLKKEIEEMETHTLEEIYEMIDTLELTKLEKEEEKILAKGSFYSGYSLEKSETLKKIFEIINDFNIEKFNPDENILYVEREWKEELTQKLKELEEQK